MRYRVLATYRGVPYEAGVGPTGSDVVLFAACPPPEELGFEPATGHWRKRVIRAEIDALWESRPVGTFRGEPCIVLDDLGDRLHIAYLGTDFATATRLGYWQIDRGVFELLTPREDVTGLTEERLHKPLSLVPPLSAAHPGPGHPGAAHLGAAPVGPGPSYPYGGPSFPAAPGPAGPGQAAPGSAAPAYQEPAHDHPGNHEATQQEPAYRDPGYGDPAYPGPAYPDPAYAGPAYHEAAYQQPASHQAAYHEPAYREPAHHEAAYREPAYQDEPNGAGQSAPPAGFAGRRGRGAPSAPAGGGNGGRSASRQRVTVRDVFCELADLAAIPRTAYALGAEVDGVLCLLPTAAGFEVFIPTAGARHEARSFADEETAYFYLFGVLAAEAVLGGKLNPAHPRDDTT